MGAARSAARVCVSRMSTPIITSIQAPQAPTLAGGTALIYGSNFQTGAIVLFGIVKSLNVQVINSGFIVADIPSVKIKGVYNITVTNPDGGTVTLANAFTAIPPVIIQNNFPYTLLVNGTDVTNFQKDRLSFSQETSIVSSYSVAQSKLSFELPCEKENLLFSVPEENHFVLMQDKNIIYQGYFEGKEINECLKIIKVDSMPFLNMLSKNPVSYSDTGTQPIASLIVSKMSALVAGLPAIYAVNPFVINGGLLDGINVGVNTDGNKQNAIDIIQNLLDLFDIGLMLYNNTIYFYAIPENLQIQTTKDISGMVQRLPEDIKDLTGTYFDNFTLVTKQIAGYGYAGTVTAGGGAVKKDLNSDNVFFADSTSAQNTVNRKNNLYSNIWKSASCAVKREANFRLGDMIKIQGAYNVYVFIVAGIEDTYTSWKLKLFGQKIN
jgi:hypothetical protein